jgi:DNA-binding NarL/FixJ family response regulator
MAVTIFIIDDHKIVRDGLKAMLLGASEYQVVGEAASESETLELLSKSRPDIVFVDLKLPDCNGSELIEKMLKLAPNIKCILLSAEPNASDLQRAKKSGALGFLTKEIGTSEYFDALNTVTKGETYISSSIKHLMEEKIISLTDREIEVLKEFAAGLSYKEIAAKLFISPRTVEAHKINLLNKMETKTIVEMVRKAIRLGLISNT